MANTLAYYGTAIIPAVKGFMVLIPDYYHKSRYLIRKFFQVVNILGWYSPNFLDHSFLFSVHHILASGASIVVEQWPCHLEVEGSSPAYTTGTGRGKRTLS